MAEPVIRTLRKLLLLTFIGMAGTIAYFARTSPAPSWPELQPGLEWRVSQLRDAEGQELESIHVWRIDQRLFRLDVAFSEVPKSLEAWEQETGAALVINGGYFSIDNGRYSPDGLTILGGRPLGASFQGFGGMLAVRQDRSELRSLADAPYDPNEQLQAGLQSFPILVRPGGRLGFGAEREDNARARRTVIAQDKKGRILFIVAPQGHFTLHQLSAYLTESDLDLDLAVNLDGGGSTGVLVASPREIIPSRALPFVILVYAR